MKTSEIYGTMTVQYGNNCMVQGKCINVWKDSRESGQVLMMHVLGSHTQYHVALGGLVVSVLATGPQGSRVQTRPRTMDFKGDKICTMPSFGGEAKPLVPCHRFTACKRTLRA
jgi:hypothetical protein